MQRSKQPKQRSKQQQQRPKQPKRRSMQQQRRQLLELELVLEQHLLELELEQRLVPVQELLLFCCKQPEQQPSGRRSAGIFSWVFLN
jgi:hypothetical protein